MHFVFMQVYTKEVVQSDKFKTGKETYVNENVIEDVTKDVFVGRIPVMVKSDLCWMSEARKDDCDFDLGGYFLVKGAEKVSRTLCLRALWTWAGCGIWSLSYGLFLCLRSHLRTFMVMLALPPSVKSFSLKIQSDINVLKGCATAALCFMKATYPAEPGSLIFPSFSYVL